MDNTKPNIKNSKASSRALTIIGIVLCVILIPLLIINVTLIIRSYTNPDKVPSFGGVVPMVVMTDSMYPEIKSGDLIICHTIDAKDVKKGDIISFFDPAGNGTSVVTHRVIEIVEKDGAIAWRTQGDANNTADIEPVPEKNLVGLYNFRIAGVGNVAMFMRTPQGLIVCVLLPILLLVGYDMLRRRKYEKEQKEDTEALLKELEELRAKSKDKE